MKHVVEKTDAVFVDINEFADKLHLNIFYDGEKKQIKLNTVNVNRPGLLLAGFDEYFGEDRVQVMGIAEQKYLQTIDAERRVRALNTLFNYNIPCIIVCRGLTPSDDLVDAARRYKRPILLSNDITSNFTNDLVMYLNDLLAPVANQHGVLVDVYGVGVLLTGHSGIGKSETALELIKRGHRLVADDAVIVKNVKSHITGSSPEAIKFLMEIRGIGIINVKEMYGVGSVEDQKEIELIINLEDWQEDKKYERLGNAEEREEILGIPIPKLTMPVRPGRNLAIIVEVAARNLKINEMGGSAINKLTEQLNI